MYEADKLERVINKYSVTVVTCSGTNVRVELLGTITEERAGAVGTDVGGFEEI